MLRRNEPVNSLHNCNLSAAARLLLALMRRRYLLTVRNVEDPLLHRTISPEVFWRLLMRQGKAETEIEDRAFTYESAIELEYLLRAARQYLFKLCHSIDVRLG
jgi:hypothetical protein